VDRDLRGMSRTRNFASLAATSQPRLGTFTYIIGRVLAQLQFVSVSHDLTSYQQARHGSEFHSKENCFVSQRARCRLTPLALRCARCRSPVRQAEPAR